MGKKKGKRTEEPTAPRFDAGKYKRPIVWVIGAIAVGIILVGMGNAAGADTVRLASQSNSISPGTCEVSPKGLYICAPAESPDGGSLIRVNAEQAVYDDGSVFVQRTGKFK